MKKINKKNKLQGSATLVIIITSIVFMLYAQSTRADVTHMTNMNKKYKHGILNRYNKEYTQKVEELNI